MSERVSTHWQALAALVRPDAARYGGLAALMALSAALPLAGPLVIRSIIDRVQAGEATTSEITSLAVVFLALSAAAQVVDVGVAWAATSNAWHTANDLRLRLTAHVLGLDHEFHRSHTPGELIQRIDGDVTSVSDFLGRVILKIGGALLLIVGMVIVLTALDWRLGAATGLYMLVAFRLAVSRRDVAVREAADEMGRYATMYGGIEERLTASEDLRSNGAGPHAMWRYVEESSAALRSSLRAENAFLILWWGVQGSVALGVVAALVASATLLERDAITLGTAFLLFQYTMLLRRPLEEIVDQLEIVQKANGAMARVSELLAIEPTIKDHGVVAPAAGSLSVGFDAVHFDYGDGEPVLHDVEFELGAGRSVGIVGRTGSGKTTISRLVLRLIETTAGTVRLGGVPIAEIPMAELRRRVALVPQDVQLLNGSVRDNVTLFDSSIPDEAVESALRNVGLTELITAGIDQPLGPGGVGLSAGESQLLALARVWLRAPDLVVLDEATSRVDPDTERRLDLAVAELLRDRTALVIAHRLSTLHRVDEILVVEDGRIVEHGDRTELAARGESEYRRLLDLALETAP